jgi:hypothetical protein
MGRSCYTGDGTAIDQVSTFWCYKTNYNRITLLSGIGSAIAIQKGVSLTRLGKIGCFC